MTVDNLISVNLITVDGESITASADENPDLFWAVRGNFSVITQFEYALHPLGPDVLAGLVVYPLEQARQVLNSYREFTLNAPEELAVWCVMRKAPPLPFLPPEVHGKEVVILAFMYAGDPEQGKKCISSLNSFGDIYGEHVGVMPYIDWQQGFDPLLTPGARQTKYVLNVHARWDDATEDQTCINWSRDFFTATTPQQELMLIL